MAASLVSTIKLTPSTTALHLLLLLLLLALIKLFFSARHRPKRRYHPIAGTTVHQFLNFNILHDYHTDLFRKHKTYRLYHPFRNLIHTADPLVVEHILKINFSNYGKGQYNYENLKELFGDGIFAVDGSHWRHQRKLASYEFSTKVLKSFSSTIFKANATKLAVVISEKLNSDSAIEIQELFMKSTMDSIFQVGFGVELNCLNGGDEGSRFTTAFDDSSVFVVNRYVDALWKLKRRFDLGFEAKLKKQIKIVDDFIYKLIHDKKEQMLNQSTLAKKEDILSRFMAEMDSDPENVTTPKYLRDITLNFLIAGRDTTAGTLSWFIFLLCKNPLLQEKIAEEVKAATESSDGEETGGFQFGNCLTEESLEKMQYLHAALSETLRLYPAVPLDPKVCFSDDTLPDGFCVDKGDLVFYNSYAMGRMESLWGDDAQVFRPESWIDEEGMYRHESPFKFTAFQAGPRICLGKQFAYKQMKIFAAVLLHYFRFELSEKSKEIHYRTMITLHIDGGLYVHAYRR